jgi:hypothetical protein
MGVTRKRDLCEHEKSAINYLINRMNTYPITHKVEDQELKTIEEILKKMIIINK